MDGWGDLSRGLNVMESVLSDPCLSVHLKIGLIFNDLSRVMQSGCYRIVSKRGADVSPPLTLAAYIDC